MTSNLRPGNDINETTKPGSNANFIDGGYSIGSPYYRTPVGEFELSDSPYGTFDQGGNITEWNETIFDGTNRGVRGGYFDSGVLSLQAANNGGGDFPSSSLSAFGIRVAGTFVPEPSTLVLAVGIFAPLAAYRRRRG